MAKRLMDEDLRQANKSTSPLKTQAFKLSNGVRYKSTAADGVAGQFAANNPAPASQVGPNSGTAGYWAGYNQQANTSGIEKFYSTVGNNLQTLLNGRGSAQYPQYAAAVNAQQQTIRNNANQAYLQGERNYTPVIPREQPPFTQGFSAGYQAPNLNPSYNGVSLVMAEDGSWVHPNYYNAPRNTGTAGFWSDPSGSSWNKTVLSGSGISNNGRNIPKSGQPNTSTNTSNSNTVNYGQPPRPEGVFNPNNKETAAQWRAYWNWEAANPQAAAAIALAEGRLSSAPVVMTREQIWQMKAAQRRKRAGTEQNSSPSYVSPVASPTPYTGTGTYYSTILNTGSG